MAPAVPTAGHRRRSPERSYRRILVVVSVCSLLPALAVEQLHPRRTAAFVGIGLAGSDHSIFSTAGFRRRKNRDTRSGIMAKPTRFESEVNPSVSLDESSVRIACIGNSIQYFNDCPRLLQNLLRTTFRGVEQDSCLRGGASLVSLLKDGNGMQTVFSTPAARNKSADGVESYDTGAPTVRDLLLSTRHRDGKSHADNGDGACHDFVIMNDHTQSPARARTRDATVQALQSEYLPIIRERRADCSVILIQTPAYREAVNHSEDLGDFDQFTYRVYNGYIEYRKAMIDASMLPERVQIAPVGMAFKCVRDTDRQMWQRLYVQDHFHPSPHGTWLQTCVLYFMIIHMTATIDLDTVATNLEYDTMWWKAARYMQPKQYKSPSPLPTRDEAAWLSNIAFDVVQEHLKRCASQAYTTADAYTDKKETKSASSSL